MAKYNAEQLKAMAAKGQTLKGTDSYPIADREDLENAIHAVGRGGADHNEIRAYIIRRARELNLGDLIPSDWDADGGLKSDMDGDEPRSTVLDLPSRAGERTFTLDDIYVRSDGDGRTVVAYMAMFDTPAEIHDQDGHYIETISRGAFDKTIANRVGQIGVFYNHGKTLYGTPSERFSMPLGVPLEITPDSKGVLTVSRYNKNPLADEVIEGIRNGDIAGQSFSGAFVKSQRSRGRGGELDHIVRSEVRLREYGPTPMPAYKEAAIMGVRAEELATALRTLSADERAELFTLLGSDLPVVGAANGTPARAEDPAADGAAHGTPEEPPTVDVVHVGPTQQERRQRLWTLKERL